MQQAYQRYESRLFHKVPARSKLFFADKLTHERQQYGLHPRSYASGV